MAMRSFSRLGNEFRSADFECDGDGRGLRRNRGDLQVRKQGLDRGVDRLVAGLADDDGFRDTSVLRDREVDGRPVGDLAAELDAGRGNGVPFRADVRVQLFVVVAHLPGREDALLTGVRRAVTALLRPGCGADVGDEVLTRLRVGFRLGLGGLARLAFGVDLRLRLRILRLNCW